jgi:hypothetical protein
VEHPAQDTWGTPLRQHYLASLNLIATETGRGLAMWADDGRPASDGNLEVRAITWIG